MNPSGRIVRAGQLRSAGRASDGIKTWQRRPVARDSNGRHNHSCLVKMFVHNSRKAGGLSAQPRRSRFLSRLNPTTAKPNRINCLTFHKPR